MMKVFLAALIVGGATVTGGVIGFLIKRVPKRILELLLCFASGIMLSASVFSLIEPALCEGGMVTASFGVMLGALFIGACECVVPNLRFVEDSDNKKELSGVVMFVFAIAIHNMPEGVAAGVSIGTDDLAVAVSVVCGIAIQNIPEGLVVVPPMLAVGVKPIKVFLIVLLTGATEVVGAFLGYFATAIFSELMPLFLAFAGGAMLYVLCDEMIPRGRDEGRLGVYVLMSGFVLMTVINEIL